MWFGAALTLVLLFQGAGAPQTPPPAAPEAPAPRDYQAEGMKALEEQKYEAAAEAFGKAVEADPKDYGALFHLALSNSLLNRDSEAIPQYKKVLELKPGLYQAELNLGMLLLRQRQAAEAVPYLEAAVQQKPKEFRPVYYLADALLASGEYAKAEGRYKEALAIDSSKAGVHAGLGRAVARQERLTEAAGHLRKAAELDPEYKGFILELAPLFEAKRQMAEAIEIYKQFPEEPAARERLGELLLEGGQTAAAIPELEEAVKKSPTAANRAALATAYLRNKQPEKGLPMLEQAVAASPGDAELRLMYGRALRDQRNFAAAAREFVKAAEANPQSREVWSELAGVLILVENYPLAISALDRLKALGPETAGQLYFRAIVLDRMKQYEPALDSYQRFLQASEGKNPDEEFKARQRIRVIQKELNRR